MEFSPDDDESLFKVFSTNGRGKYPLEIAATPIRLPSRDNIDVQNKGFWLPI